MLKAIVAGAVLMSGVAFAQSVEVVTADVPAVNDGIISQIITWVVGLVGIAVMAAVTYASTKFGFNLTEARKDQLRTRVDEFVRFGVIWAAQKLGYNLNGALSVQQKQEIIELAALDYMPLQAKETVHKLGGDVNNLKQMVQVVTARGMKVLDTPLAAPAVVAVPVAASPTKPRSQEPHPPNELA